MRYLPFRAFLLAVAFVVFSHSLHAQILRSELYNSGCGTEFWGAFPLNDIPEQNLNERQVQILSLRNGEVTYETIADGKQVSQKFQLKAGIPLLLSHPDVPMPELPIDTTKLSVAYHITSTVPVWVTALNSKALSSDAYQLIPAHLLGKEYVHCSYYDFSEFRNWAGGFCVIATENATTITLYVKCSANGTTSDGRSHSASAIDTLRVKLEKGYVYSLQGDGTTRGVFDISGTRITADKPVAVISYHNRTAIPALNMNISSSDHLIEMLTPTAMWGKQYVTREFTPRKGNGDFYRVISLEPNTIVQCKWYGANRTLQGEKTFTLTNACDVGEYNNKTVTGPFQASSVSGSAVWTSSKPFYLMHYSYSAGWDNSPAFDPTMIAVPPVEQYLPMVIANAPTGDIAPPSQYMTIFALGDTADKKNTLISTIAINDQKIISSVPTLANNYIPGTNLLSLTVPIEDGAYYLSSATRLSAEIYGTSVNEVWGLPGGRAFHILRTADTLAPALSYTKETATVKEVEYTENRSFGTQSDVGISSISLLDSANLSISYLTALPTSGVIAKGDWKRLSIRCTVRNGATDAWAVFGISDRAGNTRMDTILFQVGLPSTPLLRTPPKDTTLGTQQVRFSWDSIAFVARYHLYVVNATTNEIVINDSMLTTNSTTRTLPPAASYRWKVRAINNNGSSAYSSEWQFTIQKVLGVVELVSPPDASHHSSATIATSWKAVSDADSYTIVVMSGSTEIVNNTLSATNTIVTLPAVGTYQWKVRAKQNSGTTSEWSAPWTFIVDAINPVNEEACSHPSFTLYPQPASYRIELNNDCSREILGVEIYSVRGDAYSTATEAHYTNRLFFDINALAPGAYYLRIRTREGIEDIPFVVVH